MTSPDVVLHIGLHKAATRFLQRAVFARLDPQRFLVNPPGLHRPLKQALWYPSEETRARAREAVARARDEAGDRTLLSSEPASPATWTALENYYGEENRILEHVAEDILASGPGRHALAHFQDDDHDDLPQARSA